MAPASPRRHKPRGFPGVTAKKKPKRTDQVTIPEADRAKRGQIFLQVRLGDEHSRKVLMLAGNDRAAYPGYVRGLIDGDFKRKKLSLPPKK